VPQYNRNEDQYSFTRDRQSAVSFLGRFEFRYWAITGQGCRYL